MEDEKIIQSLVALKTVIDQAIRSVKSREYYAPEGAIYCILEEGNVLIRALKEKQKGL